MDSQEDKRNVTVVLSLFVRVTESKLAAIIELDVDSSMLTVHPRSWT